MKKRPVIVTIAALSVLSLTVWNAIRFVSTLANRDLLVEFSSPPGPLYIAITGLFWTIIGIPLSLGLWFGWGRARQAAGLAGAAYAAYYWLDRLILQSAVSNPNWPFALSCNILWLGLLALALALPESRTFFGKEAQDE